MDTESIPFWIEEGALLNFPPLTKNRECDVCIIGAGIAGLMTAYLLSKEGKKVIVLDDGPVAGGQTVRTTAHLASALDDRYYELENLFGEEGAKLARESHQAAIELVEKLVKEHAIDCDFEKLDAYLFRPPGETIDELKKEYKAAEKAGMKVDWVDKCPFPSFDTKEALRFSDQAHFHPLKFISKICELIQKQEGEIYCGTHSTSMEEHLVKTENNHRIRTKHLVVATNSPVNYYFFPHLKQAPYRTYVIAGPIPKNSIPKGLYYDTPDPYHYIQIVNGEVLIVGGEDHRTGEEADPEERYKQLEIWAKARFPELKEIKYRWSGQVLEPVDSLAFIGRADKETYIITGDSGNGLTHGILGAILINDLIHKRKSPWKKLYDPHRVNVKSAKEFLEENINSFWQYRDLVTPGENDELAPHCGKVIREGLKKCALYKDENGKIHKMSAICPHLKAVVRWNEAEHCWECPAHGSRFDAEGKVIQGPANGDLEPLS